jgi:phenylpropionate dioxygenase-like ring-hydroxylating dioxygenase large terminal subunit
MNDIFAPKHFTAVRRPLTQASTLPGWCYADDGWYAREIETIFRQEWLCIGRVEQIPQIGDFYTRTLIEQPLIVVRDTNAQVRVHSAVCRHRGAIVSQGEGRCRSFVCPYHSWTYTLTGELVGTPGNPPPMDGAEDFRKSDYGLTPIRSEEWAGFIFITFNGAAPSLLEWLGDLPALLANYDLAQMQWTHKDVYEIDCNWKVWLENAFENYHAPTIHRKHMDPHNPQNWSFETGQSGPWEANYSRRSIVAYSGLPPVEGLTEKQASGLYHIWVKPSVQIILTSSYMKFRQYFPEGANKLRLYENWTFPKTTVARADFGEIVGPAYYDRYSEIVREDLQINPVVQRGMRSGAFRPGRYSPEEFIVHRIANYVVDRVVGPEGARQSGDRGSVAQAAE